MKQVPLTRMVGRYVRYCACLVFFVCVSPAVASGVSLEWTLEAGLFYLLQKGTMRLDQSPPTFRQDLSAASLQANGYLGVRFNRHILLAGFLDIGELAFGVRSRDGVSEGPSIVLNELKLNFDQQTQQRIQTAEANCRTWLSRQSLPAYECDLFSPALDESLFLRELYVQLDVGPKQAFRITLGMRERKIGEGHVFNAFALGVFSSWDMRKLGAIPMSLRFDVFVPNASFTPEGKLSPVVHAEATWHMGQASQVRLWAGYMYDGNQLAAKTMLPIWEEAAAARLNAAYRKQIVGAPFASCLVPLTPEQETAMSQVQLTTQSTLLDTFSAACGAIPQSSGHHAWFGAYGLMKAGGWKLEGSAILYLSGYEMAVPGLSFSTLELNGNAVQNASVSGLGFLGEAKAAYTIAKGLQLEAQFLLSTGDEYDPLKDGYFAFMGISPWRGYTKQFLDRIPINFNIQPGMGMGSIGGRGLVLAGGKLTYVRDRAVSLSLAGSVMWSLVGSSYVQDEPTAGGQFFGAEATVQAQYNITKWLGLSLLSNLFFPGDFFSITNPPPVSFLMRVGMVFRFASF